MFSLAREWTVNGLCTTDKQLLLQRFPIRQFIVWHTKQVKKQSDAIGYWWYLLQQRGELHDVWGYYSFSEKKKKEEDVDDNDAGINIINVHPHPHRWRPAGTAVQYHQRLISFVMFSPHCVLPVLFVKRITFALPFWTYAVAYPVGHCLVIKTM